MDIIEVYSYDTYNYKYTKRSMDLYFYCKEENILIGKDTYGKPYALFLEDCDTVKNIVRNITFDNKNYRWRNCIITDRAVKILRKNGLLNSCYI